jgi:hypothetical protein
MKSEIERRRHRRAVNMEGVMKSLKSSALGVWLGVTAICLSFGPAGADTITTFNLTGIFTDGTTVSGTVTIDVTFPGFVESVNLSYLGNPYSTIQSQLQFSGNTPPGQISNQVGFLVDIGTSSTQFPSIHLLIEGNPEPIFLARYPGGPVCSVDHPCGPDAQGTTYRWNSTGLLGEGQVRIAARVGSQHVGIAGQLGRDREFLLFVVNIGYGHARRRPDQRSNPDARSENVTRAAWLIAAGAGLKC